MSEKTFVHRLRATARRMSAMLPALAVVLALTVLASATGTQSARANSIYIGGSGFGFSFGTGGYRGGYFYGPYGYAGPPYRPYGAPYHYHPYDMRAYPYRSRVYVNPPRGRYVGPPRGRRLGPPQRVPYTKTGLAPFTPQWAAYCARKFKTFNPNTGTYLAYSGRYRFCR